MEQSEIKKGNNLIAPFMGLAYCERYLYEGWYKNIGNGAKQYCFLVRIALCCNFILFIIFRY